MGIERGNIPDEYRCEECEPRKVEKARAIRLQIAKRNQFNDSSDSQSSTANTPPKSGKFCVYLCEHNNRNCVAIIAFKKILARSLTCCCCFFLAKDLPRLF